MCYLTNYKWKSIEKHFFLNFGMSWHRWHGTKTSCAELWKNEMLFNYFHIAVKVNIQYIGIILVTLLKQLDYNFNMSWIISYLDINQISELWPSRPVVLVERIFNGHHWEVRVSSVSICMKARLNLSTFMNVFQKCHIMAFSRISQLFFLRRVAQIFVKFYILSHFQLVFFCRCGLVSPSVKNWPYTYMSLEKQRVFTIVLWF